MLKALAKKIFRLAPYRVVRTAAANRFSAIEETMIALKGRGYIPAVILDGGANVGEFSLTARTVWPKANIHAVEPQPGCMHSLTALAERHAIKVHQIALGASPGTLSLAASASSTSTGAHVLLPGQLVGNTQAIEVPVKTLDDLLGSQLSSADRALIKLDLQGFELEALKGAERCLPAVEVILTEISFFAQAYEPPIEELIAFLHKKGFRLYDVASISSRRRDNRPHQGDLVFVAAWSSLLKDIAWS